MDDFDWKELALEILAIVAVGVCLVALVSA